MQESWYTVARQADAPTCPAGLSHRSTEPKVPMLGTATAAATAVIKREAANLKIYSTSAYHKNVASQACRNRLA